MKNCGCCNVRKKLEIKSSDKYIPLDISLKFAIMDNTKITSSDPKYDLVRSRKVLITSMGFKAKLRPHKYKKAIYAIGNFNIKDP